ncbi:hypothetical protein [Hyalangium versicolor]|uniref:hypothetical protein n=1 Tax=Hyalangium versicolor TaxID=2861190 RepID=UPI001CCA3F93|nr:hypothetical protein [Hyalangium versicolor]
MAIRTTSRPPPPPPPPPKKEVKPATSGPQQSQGAQKPANAVQTAAGTLTGAVRKDSFELEGTPKRGAVNLLAKPSAGPEVEGIPEIGAPQEIGAPEEIANKEVLTVNAAANTSNSQTLTGEQRAEADVNVQTVAEDRTKVSEMQNALKNETSQQTNDLINGTGQLPEGASVTKINDNEAEMVRKDAQGNIVERTRATRGADGSVSLESQGFKDGVNTRTRTEVTADGGTRVRNAQWQSQASEMDTQPSLDDIEQSRDGKFTYTDNRVGEKDGNGNWVAAGQGQLTVEEYAQSQGTVKGSETTYSQQQDKSYIDGYLKGAFQDGQPIDRATTKSYSIAAPQDGQQALPAYQKIERFSQGETQATSIVDKEMKDEYTTDSDLIFGNGKLETAEYAKAAGGNQPHNRADLTNLRQAHKDSGWEQKFDANNDAYEPEQAPKRWLVEMKKDPNTYASQTFVEGAPNASISTIRHREGNTVTENYGGKTFSPDGKDLVDVSGQSTSKYGADGKLDQLDVIRQDRDGSSQEHHYTRTAEQTAEGTKYTEKTDSKFQDKDLKQTSSKQEHVSLQTADGLKDLSIRSEASGPAGTAVHEVNENGDRLTFQNAQGEVRDITAAGQFQSEDEENLAVTAAATSKAMAEGSVVGSGLREKYLNSQAALGSKVDDALRGAKNATKTFEGLVGVTGMVGAGISLADAIKEKDAPAAALAGFQLGGSALETTAAASAAIKPWAGLSVFERMGTAGAVVGGVAGIWEGAMNVKEGLETGLTGQLAKGGVDIIAGAGAIGAALMGAPVLGAAIGFGGFVIKSIIDVATDDQHQIGELKIDDEGFTPPQALTPEQVAAQKQEEEARRQEEEEYWLNPFVNPVG